MLSIDAARLVLWGNAVATGRVPPDAMTHAVGAWRWRAQDGESWSLPVALAERRTRRPVQLRLVLPVSGDAGALRATPAVLAIAVAAGAAVVVEAVRPAPGDPLRVLIPSESTADGQAPRGATPRSARLLVEHPMTDPVAAQADVVTCARDLARAMNDATDALTALDVGDGRRTADLELQRRERLLAETPSGVDSRALQLLHRSLTVLAAVEVARSAEGRAISATELRLRGHALSDLARAARRGVEAAAGPGWAGPPAATPGR